MCHVKKYREWSYLQNTKGPGKKGWDCANSSRDEGTFIFISASKKSTEPYAATSISSIVLSMKPCTLFLNWLLLFPSEHMALNPHFLSGFGIHDHIWSSRYCTWKNNPILDLLQTHQNNYCGTNGNGAFTRASLHEPS